MKRASLATLAALAVLAFSGAAQAQRAFKGQSTNWRQSDRRGVSERHGSPQRFAFELRFGPYHPNVDQEFGGTGPYAKYFGDKTRFAFGLEFDWQALRIPWVGSLGPGVGWSYTSSSGAAINTNTGEQASVNTSLTIMPMHTSAVLRLDELFRRTGIPVVPYGKIGFGFATWSVGVGDESSKVVENGKEIAGSGLSYGLHFAVGGMLALDWLSPRSLASLDQEVGINHIHLFGEYLRYDLGLAGNQMRVGTSTWMVGVTLEM
jgi:hypothetical protein